jgi:PEP-CTERM motif
MPVVRGLRPPVDLKSRAFQSSTDNRKTGAGAMNIVRALQTVICGVLVILTSFGAARADVMYIYTGNFFDQFLNQNPPSGAYDSSMRVTGMFTVANPLINLSFQDITADVLHFSFSDGRNVITDLNALPFNFQQVSTDAFGRLTAWNIGVAVGNVEFNTPEQHIFTVSETIFPLNTVIDRGLIAVCTDFQNQMCLTSNGDSGFINNAAGTWSPPMDVVPLPAALPLFASGLGALGLLGWRKKRKAQATA